MELTNECLVRLYKDESYRPLLHFLINLENEVVYLRKQLEENKKIKITNECESYLKLVDEYLKILKGLNSFSDDGK